MLDQPEDTTPDHCRLFIDEEALALILDAALVGADHAEGCGDCGHVDECEWADTVRAAVETLRSGVVAHVAEEETPLYRLAVLAANVRDSLDECSEAVFAGRGVVLPRGRLGVRGRCALDYSHTENTWDANFTGYRSTSIGRFARYGRASQIRTFDHAPKPRRTTATAATRVPAAGSMPSST